MPLFFNILLLNLNTKLTLEVKIKKNVSSLNDWNVLRRDRVILLYSITGEMLN